MVKKDKNGWISVKDHLPEYPDTLVLVTVNGKPQKNITLCGAYHLATYSEQEGVDIRRVRRLDGLHGFVLARASAATT